MVHPAIIASHFLFLSITARGRMAHKGSIFFGENLLRREVYVSWRSTSNGAFFLMAWLTMDWMVV